MKTIEFYRKSETINLQCLLLDYEDRLERNELLIDELKFQNKNYDDLKKINEDYEIDISLIRMELNRRLWNDDF
jgi:hypothetical protein